LSTLLIDIIDIYLIDTSWWLVVHVFRLFGSDCYLLFDYFMTILTITLEAWLYPLTNCSILLILLHSQHFLFSWLVWKSYYWESANKFVQKETWLT